MNTSLALFEPVERGPLKFGVSIFSCLGSPVAIANCAAVGWEEVRKLCSQSGSPAFCVPATCNISFDFMCCQGVLAAVPLAFVLPAATYLKLSPGSLLSQDKLPALGLAVFGLVVALTGLWLIVTNLDEIGQCSHGHDMNYCNITGRY